MIFGEKLDYTYTLKDVVELVAAVRDKNPKKKQKPPKIKAVKLPNNYSPILDKKTRRDQP